MNFFWMILQTVIALSVVCCLIYLTFRVILPKLSEINYTKGAIRIIERTAIDARKSLLIVEVGGRWMLLSTSENNINLISELSEKEALEIEKKIATKSAKTITYGNTGASFSEKFAEVMKGKK
jgi:flagellar biosynthetic protein FliO